MIPMMCEYTRHGHKCPELSCLLDHNNQVLDRANDRKIIIIDNQVIVENLQSPKLTTQLRFKNNVMRGRLYKF